MPSTKRKHDDSQDGQEMQEIAPGQDLNRSGETGAKAITKKSKTAQDRAAVNEPSSPIGGDGYIATDRYASKAGSAMHVAGQGASLVFASPTFGSIALVILIFLRMLKMHVSEKADNLIKSKEKAGERSVNIGKADQLGFKSKDPADIATQLSEAQQNASKQDATPAAKQEYKELQDAYQKFDPEGKSKIDEALKSKADKGEAGAKQVMSDIKAGSGESAATPAATPAPPPSPAPGR